MLRAVKVTGLDVQPDAAEHGHLAALVGKAGEGEAVMGKRFAAPHPDRPPERDQHHVLVGWTHMPLTNGISLRLERTRSMVALENDQIETDELLMTRNQALLLGRYLLQSAGHDVPAQSRHRRLRGLIRGWMRPTR